MRNNMEKKAKKSKDAEEPVYYEMSSGNVFRDFGIKDPEEAQAKSDIAFLIRRFIQKNDLSQDEAAIIMGIDQPKVSKIVRGILSEFTIWRLLDCLKQLGFDVEIKATISSSVHPSLRVTA